MGLHLSVILTFRSFSIDPVDRLLSANGHPMNIMIDLIIQRHISVGVSTYLVLNICRIAVLIYANS